MLHSEEGSMLEKVGLAVRNPKERLASRIPESCLFHAVMACAGGFAMGVSMGVFMATFAAGHGELIGQGTSEQVPC